MALQPLPKIRVDFVDPYLGFAIYCLSLSGDRSLTAPTSGDWWESVDIEQKKVLLFEKDIVTLQR